MVAGYPALPGPSSPLKKPDRRSLSLWERVRVRVLPAFADRYTLTPALSQREREYFNGLLALPHFRFSVNVV